MKKIRAIETLNIHVKHRVVALVSIQQSTGLAFSIVLIEMIIFFAGDPLVCFFNRMYLYPKLTQPEKFS